MKSTKIERLVKRIKSIPFNEALEIIRPDLEVPEPPAFMCCPLHHEKTPSFGVREDFFKCFGCQAGGDIIDFVVLDDDVEWGKALSVIQYKLGFVKEDIEWLIDTVNNPPKNKISRSEWWREVEFIEMVFLDKVRPYLRCADPYISEMAWSVSDYVFEEFDDIKRSEPSTTRGKSKVIDGIIKHASGYHKYIEKECLRMTGKDRIDVISQKSNT